MHVADAPLKNIALYQDIPISAEKRQNHIGCICLTLLHCAFSNAFSNRLSEKEHSHIGCICLTFLHCAFSNVSSNGCVVTLVAFVWFFSTVCFQMHLHKSMQSRTGYICLIFLHCAFSNGPSKRLHKMMQSHTGYIC